MAELYGFKSLREARARRGLSLDSVGKKMGITRAGVSYIEQRSTRIEPSTILAFANAIGADPLELGAKVIAEAISRLPEYAQKHADVDPVELAFSVKEFLIRADYADANGNPHPLSKPSIEAPRVSAMYREYKEIAESLGLAHLGKKDFRRALSQIVKVHKVSVNRAMVQRHPRHDFTLPTPSDIQGEIAD